MGKILHFLGKGDLMNHSHSAQLYMIFALLLLVMGWKICQHASAQIEKVEAEKMVQIERLLTSID